MKNVIIFLISITFCNIIQAQWTQVGQSIDGLIEGDLAGWSVDIDANGSVVVFGEISYDGQEVNAGRVRVFENINNVWTQIGQSILGEAANTSYGHSVSINSEGTIIAIGSPVNDLAGTNSGLVQVYENINGIWTQIGTNINGESSFNQAGYSISLNSQGNILAIGSNYYGINGNQTGQVRIFENINNTWTQIGQSIIGEDQFDESGWSVDLNNDGTIVAIGAIGNKVNFGVQAGHVRIYENNNGNWIQLGQDIDAESAYDKFGYSVSLNSDGTIIAIGGIHNGENDSLAGHVRVFEYNNGNWIQIGADIDGQEGDLLGYSISISDDGSRIGIISGSSGIAKIYKNNNNSWIQVVQNINQTSANNYSARSISVNSDASYVALGLPFNTTGNVNTGQIKVFENPTLEIPETLNNTLTIYPNPTNGILYIKGSQITSEIFIYDILGKLMYSNRFFKNDDLFKIDISKFDKGIYIVKIHEGNLIYENKIVKNEK